MTFTKLQRSSNIYMQLYADVHKRLFGICEEQDDGDHLLVSRFNEAQDESEEFRNSLLELFYQGRNVLA